MPKIKVTTPFTLHKEDGTSHTFAAGEHDVSKQDAEHWYVKAHTKQAETEPAPVQGETAVKASAEAPLAPPNPPDQAGALATAQGLGSPVVPNMETPPPPPPEPEPTIRPRR